ncbi:MAG: hypothetical protein F4128_10775 [Gammaproteobacteria bacterium]|nr:hypothetical protein [Gammaproteobacteria bacterium]
MKKRMNMLPSNDKPHFPARSFRAFTGYITHPYVAWILFILITFNSLVVVRNLPRILDAETELTKSRIEFYPQLIEAHVEIRGQLESVQAAFEDCR